MKNLVAESPEGEREGWEARKIVPEQKSQSDRLPFATRARIPANQIPFHGDSSSA